MRLWRAEVVEKPAFARAYATYMAELSPDGDTAKDQRYFDLYWQEPTKRFPYLFGDTAPRGYAFVRKPDEPDVDYEMAEFCVYPLRRRQGIGRQVLPLLLKAHPGRWKASVLLSNTVGLRFWPAASQAARVQGLRWIEGDITWDYRFTTP